MKHYYKFKEGIKLQSFEDGEGCIVLDEKGDCIGVFDPQGKGYMQFGDYVEDIVDADSSMEDAPVNDKVGELLRTLSSFIIDSGVDLGTMDLTMIIKQRRGDLSVPPTIKIEINK